MTKRMLPIRALAALVTFGQVEWLDEHTPIV